MYRANVILRRFRKSLLPWESNKYYIFVCVCVCVSARACLRVLEIVGVCMRVCMRVCACSLAYPACNSYAPCCDVICGTLALLSLSTLFFK